MQVMEKAEEGHAGGGGSRQFGQGVADDAGTVGMLGHVLAAGAQKGIAAARRVAQMARLVEKVRDAFQLPRIGQVRCGGASVWAVLCHVCFLMDGARRPLRC